MIALALDVFREFGARVSMRRIPRAVEPVEEKRKGRVARLIIDEFPESFDGLPTHVKPWLPAPKSPMVEIWHAIRVVTTAMDHLALGYHHTAAMECTSDALEMLRFLRVPYVIEEDLV